MVLIGSAEPVGTHLHWFSMHLLIIGNMHRMGSQSSSVEHSSVYAAMKNGIEKHL